MRKIREEHTVAFIMDEKHLYGVVEKIEEGEEELVYVIRVRNKLYRNITEKQIIQNYGII